MDGLSFGGLNANTGGVRRTEVAMSSVRDGIFRLAILLTM